MCRIDLNLFPITLGNQPAATPQVTLADVWRFCTGSSASFSVVFPSADRVLTDQESVALLELAYRGALLRGTKTIKSFTLDKLLEAGADRRVCPLTLTHGSMVSQARLLSHYDDSCSEASAKDFLNQLLGLLPFNLWDRERKKGDLSNLLLLHDRVAEPMERYRGVLIPSCQQLARLIVELEKRVADAIRSAGPDETWKVSLEFGESTASTNVEVEEQGSGTSETVKYAHEFEWWGVGLQDHLEIHHDALPHGYANHLEIGKEWMITQYQPPLPTIESFVSPAAAVFSFVALAHYRELRLEQDTTLEELRCWKMAVYFCKLVFVLSGHDFLATLATRPKVKILPELNADVESCAREHSEAKRHSRVFAAFEGPPGERSARKRSLDEVGDAIEATEYRAAEQDFSTEASRNGLRRYEAIYDSHTRRLVEMFDGGRGFNLFDLLHDWSGVEQVIGEAKSKELWKLRKQLLKGQEVLKRCVKDIVEEKRRDRE